MADLEDCMLIPFGKKPEADLADAFNIMLDKKYTNKQALSEQAKKFSLEHAGKALCEVVSSFRNDSLDERD